MKGGHYISPSGKVIVEIRKIREGLSYKFMGNYVLDSGKSHRTESRQWIEKRLKNWLKLEFRRRLKMKKTKRQRNRKCQKKKSAKMRR